MKVVKELDGWTGVACLVEHDGNYFVVSSVNAPFSGPETLAFRADVDGKVDSFLEIAGGRRMSREEVIAQIESGNTYDYD